MDKNLLDTTDATEWADEFCKMYPEADKGAMLAWFASAIETGRSAGQRHNLLLDLEDQIEEVNRANGWYDDSRTVLEECMLLTTEVAEMAEAFRDGEMTTRHKYISDSGYAIVEPGDPNDILWSADRTPKPIGFPSECADVLIRLLDTTKRHGIDLLAETRKKLAYNATRGYRHGGKVL